MMRTARRLAKDEAGVTMALAVIMIVLLGVMGAGLFTFITRDLNTVVEENKGQRAFEMADAGIQAAKRRLISDCIGAQSATCSALYGTSGTSPWSAAQGGLDLGNLDGVGSTPDSVHVEISQPPNATNRFVVVSRGTYGFATRKIEAKFEAGAGGGGGGGNITWPNAYTKSDILVEGPGVAFNSMSLFSERNIIFDGVTNQPLCKKQGQQTICDTSPWARFKAAYEGKGVDTFTTNGKPDALGTWDSRSIAPTFGTWNTTERREMDNDNIPTGKSFNRTGFAALGLICGTTSDTSPYVTKCSGDADSIADGGYGYDKTTGSKGQQAAFQTKDPQDATPQSTSIITFPFPRDPEPNAARVYQKAREDGKIYVGGNPNWDQLIPQGQNNYVTFIDAQNHDLTYDETSNRNGIIVVWCGTLTMTGANFDGIVLNFYGDGVSGASLPYEGATTCNNSKGVLKTNNSTLQAWLYSNNDNITTPGIQFGPNTSLWFLQGGRFNLLNVVLNDPVVTSIDSKGWRELYE